MSEVTSDAIFIGCNKQTQVSDVHRHEKVVAFGAGKTIAMWRPLNESSNGVYLTLKGHDADVTCVKFMEDNNYVISVSEDHHVKIWDFSSLKCIQSVEHYKQTLVALAVVKNLFVVGSADGLISIWVLQDGKFCLSTEFFVRKGIFPLTLALSEIDSNSFLLAIGGTSVNLFMYSLTFEENGSLKCELAAELEGHEDWIKSLAFRTMETPGDFLLASGSQDRYIRLWRIRINDRSVYVDEDQDRPNLLSNKKYKFEMRNNMKVVINFEALIMGHDDWISSLKWHQSRLQLLASTADTSLIVWEPDETSGVWICGSRLGEISTKGASTATGSSGGFWSCLWFHSNGKDYILTNGKTGSWRIWSSEDTVTWEQYIGISGSTKEVTDVAWSGTGDYLLATSLDQTTRLYAPWIYNASGSKRPVATWHEFSRPQIHGYDMICVEPISNGRFVSGGDEKILRSFDLPKGVSEILQKFVGCNFKANDGIAASASLPALGLSNKAASSADQEDSEDEDPNSRETNDTKNISYDLAASLGHPPTEDQLQRHLLWPEIEKLYGHGYEISCVDVSPDSSLIASACRSNTPQHAVIRMFDTATWLELKPSLAFHALTITKLRFSKNDKYLLSVSRDRNWAIWQRNFEDKTFVLKYKKEKAHSRIIWDCDWAPLEAGEVFITASRDRSVKVWKNDIATKEFVLDGTLKLIESVTAVSIYECLIDGKILIALGLESGSVLIYTFNSGAFELLTKLDDSITPAGKIMRMRWSNMKRDDKLLLAVASSDCSCRIYSVRLNSINT
ncbi:hypothetical protein HG535_0B00530 [Zygotorulaspora mrakii]|uniref:Elongator complex protein 2 n=1 Tax=Zygotorulaspora mrakii TaxID=42260 RepID=A0A7H9AXA8_ZYGMR|nr:uncharacterized protein HG535_0B00530 [Zygotorulaspora mrakii]QLG71015.1 hypothetical protein HG535_0B00530 [Zygotorulaspora mrakii]